MGKDTFQHMEKKQTLNQNKKYTWETHSNSSLPPSMFVVSCALKSLGEARATTLCIENQNTKNEGIQFQTHSCHYWLPGW